MDKPQLIRLELRAPLIYTGDQRLTPFGAELSGPAGEPETVFLFEVDPVQGLSIEPEPALFLGPLVFSGRAAAPGEPADPQREIPAGRYLFAQERRRLDRGECIEMAIEVQKDGLWERLQPGPRLYIRFLTEEGQRISQIFRPYGDGDRPD